MAGPRETRLAAEVAADKRLQRRSGALRVLLLLGRHTDRDGWCRRSQARMADELGVRRAAVVSAIATLKRLGWLEVKAERRADGGNASASYRIVVPVAQPDLFAEPKPLQRRTPRTRSTSRAPESFNESGPDSSNESAPESFNESAIEERPLRERPLSERTTPHSAGEPGGGRGHHEALERQLREAGGAALDPTSTALMVLSEPLRWLAGGCDLEADILPVVRALAGRKPPASIRTWLFFEAAVIEARDRRTTSVRAPPDALPDNVTVLPPATGGHHARQPTRADAIDAAIRKLRGTSGGE